MRTSRSSSISPRLVRLAWLPTLAALAAPAGATAQSLTFDRPGVAFVAVVGGSNPAPQTVTLAATPSLPAPPRMTNAPPAWLAVTPVWDAAASRLTLTANAAGLAPGVYRATIDVAAAVAGVPARSLPVSLLVVALPAGAAAYAVEWKFTGYTGLVEGYPDCPVNPRGTETLVGVLAGREDVGRDDDVVYTGTLLRLTAVDFCETRGRRGPDDDERVWCAATLIGTATMRARLDVYGEEGRGAYMTMDPDGGPNTRSVTGSCEPRDQAIWEREYPGGDTAGSPSGQPIDDPSSRLFSAGRARLVVGTFPPADRGHWTLVVTAKLR